MDVDAFLGRVKRQPWYDEQVVDDRLLPAREAVHRLPSAPLHETLVERLEAMGRWPPFSHQGEAIDAALAGENVVIATPTASGKSLCFQAPILHDWLVDPASRALLLYPTKALAQDQLQALRAMAAFDPAPRIALYDGDTPRAERSGIRRDAEILLSNPDMLHFGILPNHSLWASYFQNLRTVVIDEAHTLSGVFGSHTALVVRRLLRVCRLYGAHPRFILSSATIGNPAELAENLVGAPFTAITENGAPAGEKRFLLWNPPLEKGARRAAHEDAAALLAEAVTADVQTLAFVRSRRMAEMVYARVGGTNNPLLAPYKGTYLPEDRRRVERGLRDRTLLGVAATNALELGVDIGGLDATLITGFPGSIASVWQQAGRSGRRGAAALSILVADDNPLDEYLMHHPDFLHGRSMEHALIAPENPDLLAAHLLCAAYELPLTEEDDAYFGDTMRARIDELAANDELEARQGRWQTTPAVDYPAGRVQLRSTEDHKYMLTNGATGEILEQGIDEWYTFTHLHEGAVYAHFGATHLVDALDLNDKRVVARKARVSYVTQALSNVAVHLLEDVASTVTKTGTPVALCLVEVERTVDRYKRVDIRTGKALDYPALELPPVQFRTVALRFGVSREAAEEEPDGQRLFAGLHAVEHAVAGMLPLYALCDRADIGSVSNPVHPDTDAPAIFIYDAHPGGVGIAERGYDVVERLWETAMRAVEECACADGCPGCIQSPRCEEFNENLDKGVAVELLRGILGLSASDAGLPAPGAALPLPARLPSTPASPTPATALPTPAIALPTPSTALPTPVTALPTPATAVSGGDAPPPAIDHLPFGRQEGREMLDPWLLYYPRHDHVGSPADWELPCADVRFRTADGVSLHGWHVPAPAPGAVTLLWHHGNGGNISHRLRDMARLYHGLGVGIFIYDYRGYGHSGGSPNEPGLYRDAEAALAHLLGAAGVDPGRVVYLGRSLGVAVALELAARRPPAGLILESGFPSILAMAKLTRPGMPTWMTRLMVRGRYDSAQKAADVRAPKLFVHGDRDATVPVEAGRALYDAAAPPKDLYVVAGADHNDVAEVGGTEYLSRVGAFLAGLG